MIPEIPDQKLQQYRNNRDIIRKTALQVVKDFAQFGFDIQFSGDIKYVYEELFNQLTEHITRMLDRDMEKLYNLLYRIDLSEIKIRNFTDTHPEIPLQEAITGLILDRELQKVITREMFRQDPQSI